MSFNKVRNKVKNDWEEPNMISLLEGILDAFEKFPEHYHDSYSSMYTLQNIFENDCELISSVDFQYNLVKSIDYLVSESVGVLKLSYSIDTTEGLISLTLEDAQGVINDGYYVLENGESLDDVENCIIVTFGLSDEYVNEL